MPNRINQLLISEYKRTFQDAGFFIAIGYEGLENEEINRLRGVLFEAGVQLAFVKNSLARIAIKELGHPDPESLFDKQTAIAIAEDPVSTARCLVDFAKKADAVRIHGALVEGTLLDGKAVLVLAKSPTKAELKGILSGQALSPGASLSAQFTALGGMLAGQVETHIENLEKQSA